MELFYRKYGSGQPIIILHGLLGCSDNWVSIGKSLANDFEVYLIDQRNHGKSPHSSEINYPILSNDLHNFILSHSINKPILIGHSMGGKVIMNYAHLYKELIKSIIVVDIAPKTYKASSPEFQAIKIIVDSMLKINFNVAKSRKDIEIFLLEKIRIDNIVQFLLKNLKHNSDNTFEWRINIKAIKANFNKFLDSPFENDETKIYIPSLFVKGAKSNHILYDDYATINNHFLNSQIVVIPNAGHWLHSEQPKLLLDTIKLYHLEI